MLMGQQIFLPTFRIGKISTLFRKKKKGSRRQHERPKFSGILVDCDFSNFVTTMG